jgi:transposase
MRVKPSDVVILDNLGSHNGKAVRRAIRDVGARIVFLPKYSPDLNPIEQVFAKFKTLLRKVGARSYEAVSQACADIFTPYPPKNAPHTSGTPAMRKSKSRSL